jgi:hypothetical protein
MMALSRDLQRGTEEWARALRSRGSPWDEEHALPQGAMSKRVAHDAHSHRCHGVAALRGTTLSTRWRTDSRATALELPNASDPWLAADQQVQAPRPLRPSMTRSTNRSQIASWRRGDRSPRNSARLATATHRGWSSQSRSPKAPNSTEREVQPAQEDLAQVALPSVSNVATSSARAERQSSLHRTQLRCKRHRSRTQAASCRAPKIRTGVPR